MSYHTTGRGGAGNISTGKAPEVQEGTVGSQTPHLKQEYYSTGRGGAGNMKKNEDDKETRKAQDVEYSGIEPSSSNRSVGRGGYGNIEPTASNRSAVGRGGYGNIHDHDRKKEKKGDEEGLSLLKRAKNFFR